MRIVKVGGSLFDLPDLKSRLQDWLAAHDVMPNVLIAGGWKPVDAIRQFQKIHGIDDSAAHWHSLKMMSVTGAMLSSLLNGVPISDNPTIAFGASHPSVIFQPYDWLLEQFAIAKNRLTKSDGDFFLEESWNVTSDSIAAQIALHFQADELVLLKSADYATDSTAAPANVDFLDNRFASIASGLLQTESATIKVTNFRNGKSWELSVSHNGCDQTAMPSFHILSDE